MTFKIELGNEAMLAGGGGGGGSRSYRIAFDCAENGPFVRSAWSLWCMQESLQPTDKND